MGTAHGALYPSRLVSHSNECLASPQGKRCLQSSEEIMSLVVSRSSQPIL
ncbi:Hypothetical protein SMAX5B_022180 [Scophthalmus maximus]|uniref:Uncharacterized protein n=1 Tax=Scophthalmus maximus TaxID=52904 RepID=A0A2U9B7M1_SCOMX|nr:Hypothetical protein SMAX5B_022180 [Scophthalmus maximus]